MKNETLADAIFFFLTKLQINKHVNEPHSFKAKIRDGEVHVECRGYEVYIESSYQIPNSERKMIDRFAGTTVAAANRLEALGIEFESIEMEENEK